MAVSTAELRRMHHLPVTERARFPAPNLNVSPNKERIFNGPGSSQNTPNVMVTDVSAKQKVADVVFPCKEASSVKKGKHDASTARAANVEVTFTTQSMDSDPLTVPSLTPTMGPSSHLFGPNVLPTVGSMSAQKSFFSSIREKGGQDQPGGPCSFTVRISFL